MNIAILTTCYNRKDKTLQCLLSVHQCSLPKSTTISVVLVDDGCSDGTGDLIKTAFPDTEVIRGNGDLYWNGGMRLAFAMAMQKKYDYYLWLNDDTMLYPDAISRLLFTAQNAILRDGKPAVIVGTTEAHDGSAATYGGLQRTSRWHPFKYRLGLATDVPIACDTMNGNCVLIPDEIARNIGNLDVAFIHTMGDIDYGLRARKAGFGIYAMPGFAGQCDRNKEDNSSIGMGFSKRFRRLLGKKGLPLGPWYVFTRRHGGAFWPVYWMWPTGKLTLSIMRETLQRLFSFLFYPRYEP